MLITPTGRSLSIRQPVSLSTAQTQVLVEAEVLFASLGLNLQIWCRRCRRAGEDFVCVGGYQPEQHRFTVDCACRNRTYVGTDILAPLPPGAPPVPTDVATEAKRQVTLSRQTMRQIQDFEQVLDSLDLQYILRCLACRLEDGTSDGVWGVGESTATRFVMECGCTSRVYVGADAPALTQ